MLLLVILLMTDVSRTENVSSSSMEPMFPEEEASSSVMPEPSVMSEPLMSTNKSSEACACGPNNASIHQLEKATQMKVRVYKVPYFPRGGGQEGVYYKDQTSLHLLRSLGRISIREERAITDMEKKIKIKKLGMGRIPRCRELYTIFTPHNRIRVLYITP